MAEASAIDNVRAVRWESDHLLLLDQRLLPEKIEYRVVQSAEEVADAITMMVVRGAPAIGIAAAYGVVLAVQSVLQGHTVNWRSEVETGIKKLQAARPTAVNLAWAMRRMQECINDLPEPSPDIVLEAARTIHSEDIEANRKMGIHGAAVIGETPAVLTHCNTGSLATGGIGTALGVIRTAWANDQIKNVYISETRPWLQGSRLTAWELSQDGIPATLVADSTVAWLMQSGRIGWVITGADRVAANGDVANKIGTYSHAVNARHHGIGFMVAASLSTIDPDTKSGDNIEIEERDAAEVTRISGKQMAPESIDVYNPVFDITPAELVSCLVTERGVITAPDRAAIRMHLRC